MNEFVTFSASRSINRNGPQTPLIFKEQPSVYTLAHGPVFLHCIVALNGENNLRITLTDFF